MLRQIIGKEVRELSSEDFQNLKSGFSKCVIDMGTGDGRYVYDMAKDDPQTLYVGVDADKQQMQDLSHKANRKPAKGGLDNVLFLWAPAEQAPQELVGCADELIINFPWGSLL
ncbi:MAG: hypothetical protein JNK26_00005, partial [Candidatus Doudnabacteria bacterium]|nr:hypothetical protein [Candidatus Doudnabacteria bacterium]